MPKCHVRSFGPAQAPNGRSGLVSLGRTNANDDKRSPCKRVRKIGVRIIRCALRHGPNHSDLEQRRVVRPIGFVGGKGQGHEPLRGRIIYGPLRHQDCRGARIEEGAGQA
jgi:hypothetical protein